MFQLRLTGHNMDDHHHRNSPGTRPDQVTESIANRASRGYFELFRSKIASVAAPVCDQYEYS